MRFLVAIATLTVAILGIAFVVYFFPKDRPLVTNFQECVNAGYKVLNTTPRRCEIRKGLAIVEQIPNECSGITFEQFKLQEAPWTGIPAAVDFSTYDVPAEYRQTLIEGAKTGPNFAGRYTVVENGCGAKCDVILDAKTGRIIVYDVNSIYGVRFQKDSALMIINPPAQMSSGLTPEEKRGLSTTYYKFENASLLTVCESPVR